MRSTSHGAHAFMVVVLAAAALSGCAAMQDAHDQHHHPESAVSASAAKMAPHGATGHAGMMDMKSMCDMHRKMMGAATPPEQAAVMGEHMKSMSPQARQQHMETMKHHCK